MPRIKQDALPIDRDELRSLQARLAEPFQFELIEREDARYLFVRTSHDEPDPVADLEACLERVPDWAVRDLNDVFLVAAHGSFHISGKTAQPLVDRRAHVDRAAVNELRASLDAHFGTQLIRIADDPANLVRLGVRIPRSRLADLGEADLGRIARAVGPLLDSGEARHVQIVYLVSDDDHLRLLGHELFADVAPRWEEARNERALPTVAEAPLETIVPSSTMASPSREALPPRKRPKRTIKVHPVIELETILDATPDDAATRQALEAAEATLHRLFQRHGFDVLAHVEHEGVPFALAAERSAKYPRRVLVATRDRFERLDADAMVRHARGLEADLLLVVAHRPTDEAVRKTVATKVKVIRPDEVAAVSL